jgi:tetratricopeptide (TPR) repeat protein
MSTGARLRWLSSSGPSYLGTFLLIFAAMGGLFAIDMVLAGMERREGRAEAIQLYVEGERLAAEGRVAEAIDRLRTAVSLARSNRRYQTALARVLLAAGKPKEAETILSELLQKDATDGAASLVMARTVLAQKRVREAISYYHRATYGQWGNDAEGNPVSARFELTELLARRGAQKELLAELLPLQDEAPNNLATRKRLAHLFIAAGSPSRAEDIFRDILRHNPSDPEAYAGIGEAEFARGNYRTARANFLAATRLAPKDSSIAAGLASADTVLALDPTQRGLATAEQYRRSRRVLELTLAAADSCAGAALPAPEREVLDTARSTLGREARHAPRRDAVEANLDLAERVWQVRRRQCAAPPGSADPLALVLARIAQ